MPRFQWLLVGTTYYLFDKELWIKAMKEAEVIPLNTLKRIRGKIVKIDTDGGYGFIISNEKRYVRFYFHWSALSPLVDFLSLNIGDTVEFDPVDYIDPRTNERKGWRAFKIDVV